MVLKTVKFVSFLFSILLVNNCYIQNCSAQENPTNNNIFVESNCHYGFILPHTKYIAYFIEDHIYGIHLTIGHKFNGNKPWHKTFNYPAIGGGIMHSNLGNDNIYGKLTALYFFTDRIFFNNKNRFNLGNRICFGLAYVSRKYDTESNYFDIPIATHLNAYINYSLNCSYRISALTHLKIGAEMIHISNGSMKQPNKGLNQLTSSIGVTHYFSNIQFVASNISTEDFETHKNKIIFFLGGGYKQVSMYYKYQNPVAVFSSEYSRMLTNSNWVGLALNYFYDRSNIELNKLAKDTLTQSESFRISINASYEIKMGNLSYIFQPGIYLRNKNSRYGLITNRLGLRYEFFEKYLIGISIRAHWLANADFIEWSIGYKISK